MTSDKELFRTEPGPGRLPLYEGKMIHQFEDRFAPPRYWVDEKAGWRALLRRERDEVYPERHRPPPRGKTPRGRGGRVGVALFE